MSESKAFSSTQPPWEETQPLLTQDELPAPSLPARKYGSMLATMMAAAALVVVLLGAGLVMWLTHSFQQQMQERASVSQAQDLQDLVRLLSARLEQQQRPLLQLADVVVEQLQRIPAAIPAVLKSESSLSHFYDSIQWADARGQILFHREKGQLQAADTLQEGMREALRRGLNDGKPSVQAVASGGEPEQRLSLYYVVPVRASNGQVLGVLGAGVDSSAQSWLPPAVESQAEARYFQIFDQRGRLLISNGQSLQAAAQRSSGWPQAQAQEPSISSQWQGRWLVTQAPLPWPQWTLLKASERASVLPALSATAQWWLVAVVSGVALVLAMILLIIAQPVTRLFRWAQLRPQLDEARPSQFVEQDTALGRSRPATQLAHWWKQAPLQERGEAAALVDAFVYQQAHLDALESANRQLQNRLQVLLDYSPMGLLVTERGFIQHIGMPVARMLGRTPAELIGKSVQSLSASEPAYHQLMQATARNLDLYGQFDDETCLLRKDGSRVWVRLRGQSMRRLWRGFDDLSLARADAPLVWLVEDVSTQRLVRERLSWKAYHDPLTRLPNQEAFAQHLQVWLNECTEATAQQMLQTQTRGGDECIDESGNACVDEGADASVNPTNTKPANTKPTSAVPSVLQGVLLHLDLDYFSHVNQLGGRKAGDEVLIQMARLIEAQVRPQGWLARVGGDEFAVLLPGATQEQGLRTAQSLCMAVQDWEGIHEGQRYLMGASIGLLVLDAGQYTVTSALRAADLACYAAKRKGRNRVETMAPEGCGQSAWAGV